jgi:hypothetical protein
MNLHYLGDAHDHWKGALFEHLQCEGALQDLMIDRMATDPEEWTEADFRLYARLLRVEPRQIIRDERALASRKNYFAELSHDGDLFLDPDTGIGSGSPIARYVKRKELAELLGPAGGRVIAVYRQSTCPKFTLRFWQPLKHKPSARLGKLSHQPPSRAM